jgi:hypothetical protein
MSLAKTLARRLVSRILEVDVGVAVEEKLLTMRTSDDATRQKVPQLPQEPEKSGARVTEQKRTSSNRPVLAGITLC